VTKRELRKIYLEKRARLSDRTIEQNSLAIASNFFRNFDLQKIGFLHCFLPIEKFREVDTRLIFREIWHRFPDIGTFVPRVNFENNEIESVKFIPETELSRNIWQISEPIGNETVEAEKFDIVLVPLLCFDCRGFRVGYGKGFYDKFLKMCRSDCRKIGLNFFPPVEKISDVNEFDVKLDCCITPEKVWKFLPE
jgi:5-formyltetrahydrofolate cyclo-ligase